MLNQSFLGQDQSHPCRTEERREERSSIMVIYVITKYFPFQSLTGFCQVSVADIADEKRGKLASRRANLGRIGSYFLLPLSF